MPAGRHHGGYAGSQECPKEAGGERQDSAPGADAFAERAEDLAGQEGDHEADPCGSRPLRRSPGGVCLVHSVFSVVCQVGHALSKAQLGQVDRARSEARAAAFMAGVVGE